MRIVLVDENDTPVRIAGKDEPLPGEIHRVSALWLTNSKGDVLMARRALAKRWDAGKWGTAAAGTIEEGQTYLSNILEEAREELGLVLTESDVTIGPKIKVEEREHPYFLQWYFATRDVAVEDLRSQPDEVVELKWFKVHELKRLIVENRGEFASITPGWPPGFLDIQ